MPNFSRKQLVILFLGFSSGLPYALTAATLQAWLKESNVNLATLGFISIVGIPYSFKFLWAPILDSIIVLPIGRRKGWILLCQIFLILLLTVMSFIDPGSKLLVLLSVAFLVAFVSATQDIAIDAYRREILLDKELGLGAATTQLGYRLGLILSSGGALFLADAYNWQVVYRVMAACLGLGIITTFYAPESRDLLNRSPKLQDFVIPFKEFFSRKNWKEFVALIVLYKVTDSFAMALTTPFLLELGFSKTEIGTVLKIGGTVATIVGSLFAGWCMVRLSLRSALIIFGLAQLAANLAYYSLSVVGPNIKLFTASVLIENFGSGLGTAAYLAFLMAITKREFSAAQYALFTGLFALSRLAIQFPSGVIAGQIGWSAYFLLSVVLGLPAVLLVSTRFHTWEMPTEDGIA